MNKELMEALDILEKEKEISKETEEEIKRRAIEEYLRSQQAQNNSAPSETKSDDGENKE